MIEYFLYSIGIILAFYVGFTINVKDEKSVDFIINSFVAIVFANSHVRPYYDPNMPLFQILALGVVGIGGVIGGVIGALLPRISIGVSTGFLTALIITAILSSLEYPPKGIYLISAPIFIILIITSTFLTQKFYNFTTGYRVAVSTGFILALCLDGLIGTGLDTAVGNLIRMQDSPFSCKYGCAVNTMIGVWTLLSVLTAVIQLYRRGYLKSLQLSSARMNGYRPLKQSNATSPASASSNKPTMKQKTFSYSDSFTTNYFDLEHAPAVMQPFCNIVIPIIQSVALYHGFQIDSSRNQTEHILMLLTNEIRENDTPLIGPAYRIHSRLFENYKNWCHHMGAIPNFMSKSVTNGLGVEMGLGLGVYQLSLEPNDLIEDIVVFLLIWGEASNLKHCPECLCFLYHKVMEEHLKLKSYYKDTAEPIESSRYPGYFLDMVVTPIYEVIAAGMKQGKDHHERKTYDDFNEFFWFPSCLNYSIHEDEFSNFQYHSLNQVTEEKTIIHVSVGLNSASKTYVEKRSWLHPLFSLRRVFEWHVITFTALATWAFSSELQWTYAFTFQVGSFIFLEISFMNMLWTCLEVWTLYPYASIPEPSIFGYLIRLLAGYLVLVYQAIYYHWSFVADVNKSVDNFSNLSTQHDQIFWWWQFVWISIISLFFYFLESFLCWIPWITSSIMTWNNDMIQAILNICYPLSQLYVGKNVHVSQDQVLKYIAFWLPLIMFKLWFGYRYIVHPVTVPSVEIYDDYMNFQKISFLKTSVLMFVWWFPHFLVYIIDLSIWYSVWISVAGGFVALTERQGAVRDSRSFRTHFMKSPIAFSQRIVDENSAVNKKSVGLWASTASLKDLMLQPKAETKSSTPTSKSAANTQKKPFSPRAMSSADLFSAGSLTASTSGTPPAISAGKLNYSLAKPKASSSTDSFEEIEKLGSTAIKPTSAAMNEFISQIGNQRWIIFARVWNEIIDKLREGDHINNVEKERLLFSSFDWLSKPVYLPQYQTAGCVSTVIHAYRNASTEYHAEVEPEHKMAVIEKFNKSVDGTSLEAISEAWELIAWIVTQILGSVHHSDMDVVIKKLNAISRGSDLIGSINIAGLNAAISHATNIINILKGALKSRASKPIVTPEVIRQEEEARQAANSAAATKGLSGHQNEVVSASSKTSHSTGGGGGRMKKSISVGFLQGLDSSLTSSAVNKNTSGAMNKIEKDTSSKYTKPKPFRPVKYELTDITRDKLREEVRGLLQSVKGAIFASHSSNSSNQGVWSKDDVGKLTFILSLESGFFWSDIYASKQIDAISRDSRVTKATNKLHGLLTLRQADADPSSPEANRRLNFFINSLFMDIPTAPSVQYSREYTCMTPYYSEDVLLSRADLEACNSDGISTLLYLQTLYKRDWINYLERKGIKDEHTLIWSKEFLHDTRMWASLRSQTLFRTVDGMMNTEAAVRLLAEIEQYDANTRSFTSTGAVSTNASQTPEDIESPEGKINTLAQLKFNYVVACQVYGQMNKNLESKADDIDFLLSRHPNLRVAYIDAFKYPNRNIVTGEVETLTNFFSVLIKNDPVDRRIKEVYRLQLPGNPVLGEGKPENQNHAIVFSRGRYLQAIDMNQEGYFEESLKMRNLLQEFEISNCSILGFREHIFTGSVSSVANYMALQELSFVSLGQRVLNNPLAIRQHYGHPDVFDKIFIMTEGGMSKASRGINLSEDVFAGFNATIRGRGVNFKEYVHVGKGRDVGLQQTYKFEAKLSQGNAEQSISRDMDRICDRLDFFRLMSFYYGGIGHYVSNTLVMFTLVIVVYTMVNLAVYNEEGVNGRGMLPEGAFQLVLSGMGILQTFPLAVTLTVEKGFVAAFGELTYMLLSGGPLYFIFHIQTKCYYFQQTLLAGGAMYRPTGRGFVIRHSPFDENFRFFATSHIYLGFELAVALVILALYTKSKQYGGLTWSLWMASTAFLLGPFWFNPVSFEWNKIIEDYQLFIRWMTETAGGTAEQSWESWWKEENSFYKNLSLSWKLLLVTQKCGIWLFLAYGLFGYRFWRSSSEQYRVLEVIGLYLIFFFGNWVISKQEKRLSYAVRRFASLVLSITVLVTTVYLFISHSVYVRYTLATYFAASSLAFLGLITIGTSSAPLIFAYKLHDYLVGHSLFLVLGAFTLLQLGYLQTWLLYHNALSSGVVLDDILKYASKTKELAGTERDTISTLERKLAEQEKTILTLVSLSNNTTPANEKQSLLGASQGGFGNIPIYGSTTLVSINNKTNKAATQAAIQVPKSPTVTSSPLTLGIPTTTQMLANNSPSPVTTNSGNLGTRRISNENSISVPVKFSNTQLNPQTQSAPTQITTQLVPPQSPSANHQLPAQGSNQQFPIQPSSNAHLNNTHSDTTHLNNSNASIGSGASNNSFVGNGNTNLASAPGPATATDFVFVQPTKFPAREK